MFTTALRALGVFRITVLYFAHVKLELLYRCYVIITMTQFAFFNHLIVLSLVCRYLI